jgi:hypothetical protein
MADGSGNTPLWQQMLGGFGSGAQQAYGQSAGSPMGPNSNQNAPVAGIIPKLLQRRKYPMEQPRPQGPVDPSSVYTEPNFNPTGQQAADLSSAMGMGGRPTAADGALNDPMGVGGKRMKRRTYDDQSQYGGSPADTGVPSYLSPQGFDTPPPDDFSY